jgi:hypothetical protein
MKAILIILLAIIVLLLLLRRVSGYTPQCWRASCTTEQIPDINGNLVAVPNIACLGAGSAADYCTYMDGTPVLNGSGREYFQRVGRNDPETCKNDPSWNNVGQFNADAARAADDNAVIAEQEADVARSEQQAYAQTQDSWGENSNASIS